MAMSSHPQALPPGWHHDPTGRHQYRDWDGHHWTQWVADQGRTSIDPLRHVRRRRSRHRTWRALCAQILRPLFGVPDDSGVPHLVCFSCERPFSQEECPDPIEVEGFKFHSVACMNRWIAGGRRGAP